jgi:2-oxoglutarate ferredoxin oxidoreductase subunit alpha
MARGIFTYIVGGKAGEGVKKAGAVAADMQAAEGRYVFQMDDYPSLIRGGHNFCVVSSCTTEISSHYMSADVIVALDERSYRKHAEDLAEGGVMVFNSDAVKDGEGVGVPMTTLASEYPNPELRVGVSGIASLCALTGCTKERMAGLIEREYRHDIENNVAFADAVYERVLQAAGSPFELKQGEPGDKGGEPVRRRMFTGNEAIALGAAASGLDMYIAYPMTPASTILHFLAARDEKLGVAVIHPESEIAVANMAIGAAAAGARVAVGTSGGGMALMEEAFSFAGMAEVPLLCVMSSRPGPSSGVPTYTEQADLRFALGQGHGDFPRVIASPGSVAEAFTLSAELMELAWEFQTPGMLLTEKHLSESRMTVELDVESAAWASGRMHKGGDYKRYLSTDDGVSPMLFPPSAELINWSSYEHDEVGITTEEGPGIAAMHDKRDRKGAAITERLRTMNTVNRFGKEGPVILTYGSTTLSVLEALAAGDIKARVVQPVYLEPFPVWEFEDVPDEDVIVVEQSSTGQFATLMAERGGVCASDVILRYDGRPFDPLELADDIHKAIG